MRRVFVILAIVAVLGIVTGGILWYVHRNSVSRLLSRSELALRATSTTARWSWRSRRSPRNPRIGGATT